MPSSRALSQDIKTIRMKPDGSNYAVSAGTSTLTSNIIDTAGYEGVRFVWLFGAIVTGGAPAVKVQQDTDVAGGGMADLEGTAQAPADTDDSKLFISEVVRPRERYLRVVTTRATQNATVDGLIAELFGPRRKPITKDTTVGGQEVAVSPVEGTA